MSVVSAPVIGSGISAEGSEIPVSSSPAKVGVSPVASVVLVVLVSLVRAAFGFTDSVCEAIGSSLLACGSGVVCANSAGAVAEDESAAGAVSEDKSAAGAVVVDGSAAGAVIGDGSAAGAVAEDKSAAGAVITETAVNGVG